MKHSSRYRSFFKSKQGIAALILAFVLLVTAIAVGITAAYRSEDDYEGTAAASRFYFTVDLLGETVADSSLTKTVHLYGGNAKVLPFTVQNYFDSLRITERDTAYTVSLAASGATASMNEIGDSSLAGGVKSEKAYQLSIDAGYDDSATVTVTVRSTEPYVKEMRLIFVLHTYEAPLTYRIEDEAGVLNARLILMANVDIEKGKLVFDWSNAKTTGGVSQNTANILPVDSNNTYVIGNTVSLGEYLKSITVQKNLSAGQSIAIDFMKTDPAANYSIEETKVYPDAGGHFTIIADFS